MSQIFDKIVFVTHVDDVLGNKALGVLKKRGIRTLTLEDGENAPVFSMAIFSKPQNMSVSLPQEVSVAMNDSSHLLNFPGSYLRWASHRLLYFRPDWAKTTPFACAVKDNGKGNFARAISSMADDLSDWLYGKTGSSAPWLPAGQKSSYNTLMEHWLDSVVLSLPEDMVYQILNSPSLPKVLRGRGGGVVYYHLIDTGRVVQTPEDLPSVGLDENWLFNELTGIKGVPVAYGTSDLFNVFELLTTLKAGDELDSPVLYDVYPSAHDLQYWLDGFLNPSLAAIGKSPITPEELGLKSMSKYSDPIDSACFCEAMAARGLTNCTDQIQGDSLAEIYQNFARVMVDYVQDLLRINVPYGIATTEEIMQVTGMWWGMPAHQYAQALEEVVGHSVVALNGPDGEQLYTADLVKSTHTIEEYHAMGYWLGGAAIYELMFSLGMHGGMVMLVKDSSMGLVNMLAKPYLSDSSGSQLYLMPVGLFRLPAQGQKEDWSIDPFVFYHLLATWSRFKAAQVMRQIWGAIEAPLDKSHIGYKTIAEINSDGVTIKVNPRV